MAVNADKVLKQLDNYIIVDVGANLTNKKFARDLDAVVQRAKDAGVTKIMVTGTSMQASRDALRLTSSFKIHIATVVTLRRSLFPTGNASCF